MSKELIKDLQQVFGQPAEEAITNTARVMTMPSSISRDLAAKSIEYLDTSKIFRDLGFLAARELSDSLEAMALRPADYADLPDLVQHIASKLSKELSKVPEEFSKALIEQLRLRG